MNTLHATDLLEYVVDAVIVTDQNFKVLFWNKASEDLYGYKTSEVLGRSLSEILPITYKNTTQEQVLEEFYTTGKWQGEALQISKFGQTIPILASVSKVTNNENKVIGVIAINRDISDRVATEKALTRLNQQLKKSAFYDHLTNLPNRRYLERLFEKYLLTELNKQLWFLVCLDLNGFKAVNDSYGHDVGDQLLIKVGKRLALSVREGDYVARFGGDEFVLLLKAKEHTDVLHLLYRLVTILEHHIYTNGLSLKVSVSMGLAQMSHSDKTFESLFRKADKAMYQAKESKVAVMVYSGDVQFDSTFTPLSSDPRHVEDG